MKNMPTVGIEPTEMLCQLTYAVRSVRVYDIATQPEMHKFQRVCCRLVTLLSSNQYQDAFASLAAT